VTVAGHQNSAQFMMTRPRQISLLQMTLHFSCTVAPPQTGQMIADESAATGPLLLDALSGPGFEFSAFKT
jgi:hypothetical protein